MGEEEEKRDGGADGCSGHLLDEPKENGKDCKSLQM